MPSANQADWSRAAARFPVTNLTADAGFWIEFFADRPGVLHQLLGDLYLITKAHESEHRRGGRRSRNINGNLDELWAMLTPRFAVVPFGPAVSDLMGDQSLRRFAAKIPMHHHSLARFISGERPIVRFYDPGGSMHVLESIAAAGGVHAAYFAEWRELFIFNVLHEVFADAPNTSITVFKKLINQIESPQRALTG